MMDYRAHAGRGHTLAHHAQFPPSSLLACPHAAGAARPKAVSLLPRTVLRSSVHPRLEARPAALNHAAAPRAADASAPVPLQAAAGFTPLRRGLCPSPAASEPRSLVVAQAARTDAASPQKPDDNSGTSELETVKDEVLGVKGKIAQLELLPVGDPERQRLAGLEQQLAGLQQRLAALQEKENLLLKAEQGMAKPARITVKDRAAKLVRHTDDPTMYTVHPVSGPTTLFHDPDGVIDQLRTYLKKAQPVWCTETAGAHILPLVISGGIKVGKTFLLNTILPAVMAEMEKDFGGTSCMQLNLQGVERSQGFGALCESLLNMVKAAADEVNLTTPALRNRAGVTAPAQLRAIFRTMDQPLAVQLDEVQWLLSPRLPDGSIDRRTQEDVAVLLRDLLCYSSLYCQWAVTGSSMALFWVQLGLIPANGITPLTHKFPVHLPHTHSSQAKTKVLAHLLGRASVQHPPGQLPPDYQAIHDYADNCAMASFAFEEFDKQPGRKTVHQCLDDLDRGKVAAESKAEWSIVVKHELTDTQRRTLAGLYDTINGCDLSVLGCQGLEEMLGTLTTPVRPGSSCVYLTSHFYRAGLAMCVTADGKVVDVFAGLNSSRSLRQIDAFVQMFLMGNKAKKLVRDPAYYNNRQLLQDALQDPACLLEGLLGSAQQWRDLDWFKDVLLAAENQGEGVKVGAADEAEVRHNGQGAAAAYLRDVDWHAWKKKVMPPERHLAWYLCLLRNCLGHADDDAYPINVAQAPLSAFQLLAQSPVVQPSETIMLRFADIRACKLP